MTNLLEEIRRDQGDAAALEGLYSATIAETAVAVTDLLPVLVDGWDTGLQLGPCRWMPRVTSATVNVAEGVEATHNITVAQLLMPTRGDRCKVQFDDGAQPVIVVWWPAAWGVE